MSKPLVSVLLTSYNHERWLRECVESALSQTYEQVEIIAVDDGSTDASREILRSYEPQIRLYVNERNLGTYGSLNKAMEMAEGEYCAVLNSDDKWAPTKLERQLDEMRLHPNHSFCHTFGAFIDDDGNRISGEPMGFPFPRMESGQHLTTFIANNTAIASSVLFRRDLARDLGGFNENLKILGDWDMWLRLAEKGTVGFVDEELTYYRVHGTNTIYQLEPKYREEVFIREAWTSRAEELIAHAPDPAAMKRALAHSFACLGSLYSILGEPGRARRAYLRSLRLNPLRLKSLLRIGVTWLPLSLRRKLL
ncbi:MAG: glycosyltransferase [Armatimonadetes bacterium]|nr:MAG: glycosyltransferase [Armatimonadota bacterium]